MKYPNYKDYVRFYKYGIMRMVWIGNPISDPYVRIYEDDIVYGMICIEKRTIRIYYPYVYSDWVQIDKPPDHIHKKQKFKWYYEKWKKNK